MIQGSTKRLQWGMLTIGVIAFALIVSDRVRKTVQVDDAPDEQALISQEEVKSAVQTLDGAVAPSVTDTADTLTASSGVRSSDVPDADISGADALVTLEKLFGSPVVLVSASEPSYVVTAAAERFDVGGVIAEGTTLAGVTSQQLILEQSDDLLVVNLPEPIAQ